MGMRKLLLILLLLVVIGCGGEMFKPYEETEAYKQEQLVVRDKRAMLTDGRIYIGMPAGLFVGRWGTDIYPDRSISAYGVTEWWKFNRNCESCGWLAVHYSFCFENGILDYWSEN